MTFPGSVFKAESVAVAATQIECGRDRRPGP
jgi:hypothetical protein